MDFVVCPECTGLVDLNGGNCHSPDRGINIFHATCYIVRLELERNRDWKAVDALSPRFRHPDFKFASFAGAVEAMIKDREDADSEVKSLKDAIRNHRDQRGNDRCHLDDAELYQVLGEGQPDTALPPREEFLANCARFYECRQAPKDK